MGRETNFFERAWKQSFAVVDLCVCVFLSRKTNVYSVEFNKTVIIGKIAGIWSTFMRVFNDDRGSINAASRTIGSKSPIHLQIKEKLWKFREYSVHVLE